MISSTRKDDKLNTKNKFIPKLQDLKVTQKRQKTSQYFVYYQTFTVDH